MTRHQYQVHADVPATDVMVLLDALDGERLELTERLGAGELERQIESFTIDVDHTWPTRWAALDQDLEVLSRYLAAPMSATEVIVPDAGPASGSRLLAWHGEVVRFPLKVHRTHDGVVIDGEDLEALAIALPRMPGWAQSLLAPRLPRQPTA